MNELPPQHYEMVLKYMETTNEQSFQQATMALQETQFNLQLAIQNKFNPPQPSRARASRSASGETDQEIVRRFVEHMQIKNRKWSIIDSVFGFVKTFVLGFLGLLSRILPDSLRIRYFGTGFQRIYRGKLPYAFTSRTLPSLLRQTSNISSRSVLLVVAPSKQHPDILKLLSKQQLQRPITRNFYLTGHTLGQAELTATRLNFEAPMLIVLRNNIFDQIVEIDRTRDLAKVDARLLDRWAREGKNLYKRDCNVIIKYRNFVNRAFGNFYEEEEQEQVNLVEVEQTSQEIQQQNRLYKQMQIEAKKQRELQGERMRREEEQLQKIQEFEAERELRKSSIPTEPTQGEIIRFSFRCPDGLTMFRNFSLNEKLDLVFQWVQLNDEIQFQDARRNFQIMYNYPPRPLSQKRDSSLCQIFQSRQQKLLIREL